MFGDMKSSSSEHSCDVQPRPSAVITAGALEHYYVFYFRLALQSHSMEVTPASLFSSIQQDDVFFSLPELTSLPALESYAVGERYLTYHILCAVSDKERAEEITSLLSPLGAVSYESLERIKSVDSKQATEIFSQCVLSSPGTSFQNMVALLTDAIQPLIASVVFESHEEPVVSESESDFECRGDIALEQPQSPQDLTDGSDDEQIQIEPNEQPSVDEEIQQVDLQKQADELHAADGISEFSLPAGLPSDSLQVGQVDLEEKHSALIARVGELLGLNSKLYEYATQTSDDLLLSMAGEVDRISASLRDATLDLRKSAVEPYMLSLKDWLTESNANISFEYHGGDTQLDRASISAFVDALAAYFSVCLSVSGSASEQLCIDLQFEYSGTEVLVVVSHTSSVPYEELSEALIKFQSAIFALHGSMAVGYEENGAAVLKVSLPVTQAMVEGLIVQCGDEQYIVPMNQVADCIDCGSRMGIEAKENRIVLGGETIPYVRLREFVGMDNTCEQEQCIVIQSLSGTFGLIVDNVVSELQTVVKPLGIPFKHVEMLSGVSTSVGEAPCLVLNLQHFQSVADCLIVQ